VNDQHVRVAQPQVDKQNRDLGQRAVVEPLRVYPERVAQKRVDRPERGVEQANPDKDADEAGDRVGDDRQRAQHALERKPLVVEHERQEQAEAKGEEDRQACEYERPDEDADECTQTAADR